MEGGNQSGSDGVKKGVHVNRGARKKDLAKGGALKVPGVLCMNYHHYTYKSQ